MKFLIDSLTGYVIVGFLTSQAEVSGNSLYDSGKLVARGLSTSYSLINYTGELSEDLSAKISRGSVKYNVEIDQFELDEEIENAWVRKMNSQRTSQDYVEYLMHNFSPSPWVPIFPTVSGTGENL